MEPERAGSAPPPGGSGPINLEAVLNACMGNTAVTAKVLDEFEKHLGRGIAALEEGVREGNAKQTAELAHALKGVAGVMSAAGLREAAARLEEMGRNKCLEHAQGQLAALQREVDDCLACLPALRSDLQKKSGTPRPKKTGPTILIADDSPVALRLLEGVLGDAGYDVLTARDGQEALELIRTRTVRLVVSDWEMPRMTGPELCQAVRSEDLPSYVYLILLTSHDKVQERVEGLSAGADDFVSKPFDASELLARVRSGERVLALETREVAIFAMAKLAESRDPETGAHLERVRSYSRVIAQHLATVPRFAHLVDSEYIRLTYLTSPLHDIGKVGIPDRVLLKPGRLSKEEFEIMKTHTTVGAKTLDAALTRFPGTRFLEMARHIAAAHHERYDGTGYPLGLKGEEIPLCARIVALPDVYDALTSKRVYKQASSHEVARGMIIDASGSHFDPEVVKAFVQNENRFIAIGEKFAEDLQPTK